MIEFLIGVTEEELRGCESSTDPNDRAFLDVYAALVRAWRTGYALRYIPAARAIANGQRVVSVGMIEPSDN